MEVTNPAPEVAEVQEAEAAAIFDKMFAEEASDEVEATEADQVEEADDDATDEAEAVETDQAEADPIEEVEYEGEKFKVPPKVAEVVKKATSLQADYTRKTQEVAEKRRLVDDRAQYLDAREQLLSTAFQEAAEMTALETQLKQFDGIDWQTLVNDNPQQAMQFQIARQQAASKLDEVRRKVQTVAQNLQQAQEKHKTVQAELGRAELKRRIGDLSDQDRARLMTAAQELGFEEADLWRPQALHALHLASKYMELQKAKPAVAKKAAEAKPMKPVSRSAPQAQREGVVAQLQDKLKRTGDRKYADAYFERRFGKT